MHANLSKSTLSVTEWDRQELLDRVDGDRSFFCELLVIFRTDAQLSLKSAEDCLNNSDLLGLSRAAHTFKGMLRNLAMHHAAELAASLEKCAGASQADSCEKILAQLNTAVGKILPEIETHLAKVPA